MTQKNEENYRKNIICQFCENKISSDKVSDHCHLTGKYRCPALSKCNINVKQKQSIFITLKFHSFSNNDCHMFFKRLVELRTDKVNIDIIPKRNENIKSVTYGCISFVDSYKFLSSSLDKLVKTLVDNSHKTLKDFKEETVDNDEKINIVKEVKIKIEEDNYNKDSI